MVVRIVDPESCRAVPDGVIGEIWVGSPSKASSYFGRPEDTEVLLSARIAGTQGVRRYLRTGDLGLLHERELFVTGRRKDLIIVAGRNVSAVDIEEVVCAASTAAAIDPTVPPEASVEDVPEELIMPAGAWLAKHGLAPPPAALMTAWNGCGYGYLSDEVPAWFLLRYARIVTSPPTHPLSLKGEIRTSGSVWPACLSKRTASGLGSAPR